MVVSALIFPSVTRLRLSMFDSVVVAGTSIMVAVVNLSSDVSSLGIAGLTVSSVSISGVVTSSVSNPLV